MEDLKFYLGLILVVGALLFGVVGLANWGLQTTCNQRYASFEHDYGFFKGCVIKINDRWVPDDSFYVKEDIK